MPIKPSKRLDAVKEYYFSRKLAEIAELNKKGDPIINLGIGSPDLAPHPSVIRKLHESSGIDQNHGYQSYRGIPELRKAISDWYITTYNVELNSNSEVLPLIGSKEGIMHISMAFLEPGAKVLVPDPGYPAYSVTAKLAGAEVIYYPLMEGSWWPDMAWLNSLDTADIKLMWINYPHMPTGAEGSQNLFKVLIEWAIFNDLIICNDNPYSLILNQSPPLSLLSVKGSKDVALELNSLSKSHNMAGWRVGMLLGSKEHINTVLKVKSNMDSGMFKAVQEAAVQALSLGEDWHNNLNSIYSARRQAAQKIMDLLSVKYDHRQVGMFIWGKVPDSVGDVEQFIDLLLYNARVFITPGSIFGHGGKRYLRISLCSPVSIFEEARSRIANFLNLQSQ